MTQIQIHRKHEPAIPRLVKALKPLQPVRIAPQRMPVKVMSPVRFWRVRQASS